MYWKSRDPEFDSHTASACASHQWGPTKWRWGNCESGGKYCSLLPGS